MLLYSETKVVIDCTGAKNEMNAPIFGGRFKVDQNGSLVVGEYLELQLAGDPQTFEFEREPEEIEASVWRVYGAGDCIRSPKNSKRLAYIAMIQADFISFNLMAIHKHLKKASNRIKDRIGLSHLPLIDLTSRFRPTSDPENWANMYGMKRYTSVKEPEVLLLYVGDRVIRCHKDGVSTCSCINRLIKWYIQVTNVGYYKGNCLCGCLTRINGIFNRLVYT